MDEAVTANIEGFFVSGGTVPLQLRSYVERAADAALLDALSSGKFCYVLNSRQMGKSSLCVKAGKTIQIGLPGGDPRGTLATVPAVDR